MYSRAMLKKKAKSTLRLNYWKSVLAALLFTVVTGGAATPTVKVVVNSNGFKVNATWLGWVDWVKLQFFFLTMTGVAIFVLLALIALKILVLNPLQVGVRRFALVNASQPAVLDELGGGFGAHYMSNVKAMVLTDLYIALWTMLFFIPGVVASYRYRMVPYLLAEHPGMPAKVALQRSKEMMAGQKFSAFVLDLSFLGWFILSGMTGGLLGVFFVGPYKMQTDANLYLALSRSGQGSASAL